MGDTISPRADSTKTQEHWKIPSVDIDTTKISTLWSCAWKNLLADLRAAGWRRSLGWFFSLGWLAGLALLLAKLGYDSERARLGYGFSPGSRQGCMPDGTFTFVFRKNGWSYWSADGFFQITLGFGIFSFAGVKTLDIFWNIVIGRMGQGALAYVSWRVFRDYMTMKMQTTPITYQGFRIFFLQDSATVVSTWAIIRSFYRRRICSITAMIFIILTMVFIVLWPTLASAMSGYDGVMKAHVNVNGTLVPLFGSDSSHVAACFTIQDGSRIGLKDNYNTCGIRKPDSGETINRKCSFGDMSDPNLALCRQYDEVLAYYERFRGRGRYGSLRTNKESGMFPSNITIFNGNNTDQSFDLQPPILNVSRPSGSNLYLFGDTFFNAAGIQTVGICQKDSDSYQWGFSYLQLFIVVLLLILWTLGIFTLWLRTNCQMDLTKWIERRVPGEIIATLELASAIKKELDIDDVDRELLDENCLWRRVEKEINGGSMMLASSYPEGTGFRQLLLGELRAALSQHNRWWVIMACVFAFLFMTISMLRPKEEDPAGLFFWTLFLGLFVGSLFALRIGSTFHSRALIVVAFALLSLPFLAPVLMYPPFENS